MNAEFDCAQCRKNRKKVAVKSGHAARFSGLILTLQSLSISDHCPNWLSKLRKPSPPGLRISATNPPSVGAAQRRLKYSPPPKKKRLYVAPCRPGSKGKQTREFTNPESFAWHLWPDLYIKTESAFYCFHSGSIEEPVTHRDSFHVCLLLPGTAKRKWRSPQHTTETHCFHIRCTFVCHPFECCSWGVD